MSTFKIDTMHAKRVYTSAGFTLLEILVVLAIIGMVMGLVGPRVLNYLADSKAKTTQIQLLSLSGSLDLFFLDNGRYPTSSEGLGALVARPQAADRWNGPYLKPAALPVDGWGRPYVYRSPGQGGGAYDLTSLGPSGQEGGSDNVGARQ